MGKTPWNCIVGWCRDGLVLYASGEKSTYFVDASMCGIAGAMGHAVTPRDRVDLCLRSMSHRGPDDRGAWQRAVQGGVDVLLMHTRLSIIDLGVRAAQPMEADGLTLIFNGEIYNYKELRRELQRDGVRFETESDTEVLLRGIRHEGWGFLDKAEGMWALAAYDSTCETLSLSRDRFGEKPLWYHLDGGFLAFASEVGSIEALLGKSLAPDLNQLRRFITLGYRSVFTSGRSFVVGVESVAPGQTIHFEASGRQYRENFWDRAVEPSDNPSFASAAVQCRDLLCTSLELRLRSDVPIAFSLSGGVDSVVLAALARRVLGIEVHGFTVSNVDPRYEERDEVEAAVAELSLQHTWVSARTANFLEDLRRLTDGRGSPILTLSSFAQSVLMERVHQAGYKVVIGGTAADEVFSGYYDHHLFYIASLDGPAQTAAEEAWRQVTLPYVRNPLLRDGFAVARNPGERSHIYYEAQTFSDLLHTPLDISFHERALSTAPLRNRLLNEMFHETVPVLLHEEDLNAMRVSVENRSPYLDRRLFEYVSGLPVDYMVRGGLAKALLREVGRGLAPSAILANPRKVGFNLPLDDVVNVGVLMESGPLRSSAPIWEMVSRTRFEEFISHGAQRNSASKFVFSVLSANAFLETFQ